MLNYIYYIIYQSYKTPGRKRKGGRKQTAKHAFTILIGVYAQFPIWLLFLVACYLNLINPDHFVPLIFITFFCVALPVSFILNKKYSYEKINTVEAKYDGSLKVWQAKALFILLVNSAVAIMLFFAIQTAKISRVQQGKVNSTVSLSLSKAC